MRFTDLTIAFILVVLAVHICANTVEYSFFSNKDQWTVKEGRIEGQDVIAWSSFSDTVQSSGWSTLNIKTNGSFSDSKQAFAAGFAEGHTTASVLETYYLSFKEYAFNKSLAEPLSDYLEKNMNYIDSQIKLSRSKSSSEDEQLFWHHINLIKLQVEGMYAGYKAAKKEAAKMTLIDFYRFQLDGDVGDIQASFRKDELKFHEMSLPQVKRYALENSHCSGLVKYTPDRQELLATQSTWDKYNNMLRMYKHFNLGFVGTSISFSSSPGWLVSVDDFYITSNNLVILETTNNVYNAKLYDQVKPVGSVLYWMRNMVANRLSKSGPDWVKWFSMYNSGTYNNQWMIVDYNLFNPGAQKSQKNLLYILEQMPGEIRSRDASDILDTQGYWPSYNVPFDPYIFNISGYADMQKQKGDDFGYETCPRAKIFKRDVHKVHDLESMKRMIRYNDFKNDPLSGGDACDAIAARCDLNVVKNNDPDDDLRSFPFGQIDAKITSAKMVKQMECVAQSGPTHYDQPAFEWIEKWKDTPHVLQPQKFEFDWVQMRPNL